MREFTDSGASTLLVIAVAFCHLSIFGNWTVRNHLIEKCLHIISASKEDIMCQSMKWKVLLFLQVKLLQLTDFKPQHSSWPFGRAKLWGCHMYYQVLQRAFWFYTAKYQCSLFKSIAVLPAPHQKSTIFLKYHCLSQQITAVSVLSCLDLFLSLIKHFSFQNCGSQQSQ